MKKSKLSLMALFLALTMGMTACGGKSGANESESVKESEVASVEEGYITVDPLNIEGLNSDYAPKKNRIKKMEGSIDVVLVFDGTEAGWQALADEYSRLHGGNVAVVLNKTYTAATYSEKADEEISNPNTDWDIVQGNVVNASYWESRFVNMRAAVDGKNPYAGNATWTEVIEEDAYITDKSGESENCFIMNSINLNTGWFVNGIALEEAFGAGYVNKNGEKANPVSWDDLINLCQTLYGLGYKYPLGISVDEDSVKNSQFTWLLRIYGDYYYRDMYNVVDSNGDFKLDVTATNPESDKDFEYSLNSLLNTVLDTSSKIGGVDTYVGATSPRFKDFLTQIGKIRPYLNENAGGLSFEDMRNAFRTQSNGKDSPQIMLDYVGSGLLFANADQSKLKADVFDYPTMYNSFVDSRTITRDVGGNGGYLSVVKHDLVQNELNIDFMKFVMSPYGQSIYYDALSKVEGFAPQGLTTVRNDLVQIPSQWAAFFDSSKISFNGLSDSNKYIEWFIRGVNTDATASREAFNYWTKYLVGKGSDQLTLDNFAAQWHGVVTAAFPRVATTLGWNPNCYKYPGLTDGEVDHNAEGV